MSRAGEWEISVPVVDEEAGPRRSLLTGARPLDDDRRADPPFASIRTSRMRVDFDQVEARRERRAGWSAMVHYLEFDAVSEVRGQVAPLAAQISELLATPPVFKEPRADEVQGVVSIAPGFHVVAVAAAVHTLRVELTKVLASSGPASGVRDRLAAVVRDPAHERRPEIDNDSLRSGRWADALVAHIEPLSADLAAVVAERPCGFVSSLDVAISDVLSASDGLDRSVRDLQRRVADLRRQKASWRRNEREAVDLAASRQRERETAALRRLGL